MSDQEMLELLAADAPAPRPGHVDEVLVRARRARLRRHVSVWATGLGVVAVSLVAATLVAPLVAPSANGRQYTTQPGASAGTAPNTTRVPTASPDADQALTAEAGAYAAAIRALADQVREGGPQWPILYLLDHTCANVVTPTQGNCDAQGLPPTMRNDLTAALASYAPVRFVSDGAELIEPGTGLAVVNGGVQVTLGRIQLHDDQALVPLSVRRNGLNGRGLTYRVTRKGETWQVEGTVGSEWIS
jgi:hypothetical protein